MPKGLKFDNLKIWRDVAKKNNIPLYVHHSGVSEHWYPAHRPEYAECDKDGNSIASISLFGPYAEDYLIPALKEMIDRYDIDGVWMGGECWTVHRDYSKHAKEHMPGGYYINFLNMYQNRYDVKFDIFDEVPPLYDIELCVYGKYNEVSMPFGEKFEYEIKDHCVIIRLNKLEIHSVIELR